MAEPVDPWDETLLELGYINCRPCKEWHRSPECAIDTEGFALQSCGCRWSDNGDHRSECPLSEVPESAEREDDRG